jgi:hypothetical protein
VVLTRGTATVRITGDVKAKLTLPLGQNGAYQPSPGAFSLSYAGRAGNGVIVSGTTPLGRARTSSSLTLSLVVQEQRALVFSSGQGECSITVTSAAAARIEADFRCHGLRTKGKSISATGHFVAFR